MTFRRALRMIAKRWWLPLLGGVAVTALALVIAMQRKPHYVLTSTLSASDIVVQPKNGHPGFDVLLSPQKFPDSWVVQDFQSYKAASEASQAVGGPPSPAQILNSLTLTGLTGTTVSLKYTGGSDADA